MVYKLFLRSILRHQRNPINTVLDKARSVSGPSARPVASKWRRFHSLICALTVSEGQSVQCAVWTIPAGRMKAGREQRVPLSPRALAVLDEFRRRRLGAGTVFPTPTGRTQPHP